MLTLHLYAARELVKTFAMTLVTLTVLVVMGGGLANIFRGQGVGADEMAKALVYLTPVAITLVLPIAALFSAAITYGRMAADNEILACSAAGVNILRVLLPTALLGLAVTILTYWSWNFFIPNLSRQIEEVTRRDLPKIVEGEFRKAKPLNFGRYRLAARKCEALDPDRLPPDLPKEHVYLQLTGVAFVETEDQELLRYGTADYTIVQFDRTSGVPKVTVGLQAVRSFDAQRKQYYELEQQVLGPFEVPLPIRRKLKFENLTRLLEYRKTPELVPEIGDILGGIEREMMTHFLFQDAQRNLDVEQGGEGVWRLADKEAQYEITAEAYAVDPDDGQTSLKGVRVIERTASDGRLLTADRASIELRSGLDRNRPVILVELADNVEIRRRPPESSHRVVRKPKETLRPIQFAEQPQLAGQVESFDLLSLMDSGRSFDLTPKQERMRKRLLTWLAKSDSKIQGEIHFRASYSLAAIAIVLFGAVLGIIVRGGQVLTAFGISCLPMGFVVMGSIVGRNLADRPDYTLSSISIMWGATILMYAATAFVALRVLRR